MRLKKTFIFSFFAAFMLVFSTSVAEAKVMWGKTELKQGQIGKVTILSDVRSNKIVNNTTPLAKELKNGGEFRVYSYRVVGKNGYYGLGGGLFVQKSSKIKYETPSKRKLAQLANESGLNGLVSSGVPIQGKINSKDDSKEYTFTTNQDGEVYITVDRTTGGFSMYLYDVNGNRVGGDYFSTIGKQIVIDKNIKKGTYTIKVTPYRWSGISSATYQLKATYASANQRNTTTFEPNETVETSHSIKSGQIYKSTGESNIDQDVYQFSTNKDARRSIFP